MPTIQPTPSPLFTRLVYVAFGLMAAVLMLSAYLRLSGAGFGCADWPACYGQNFADAATIGQSNNPVRLAHRLIAIAFSLIIWAITMVAWQRRKQAAGQWWAALLALFLTLFLSGLGIVTPGTRLPAVVLGNLLGGTALLAVLWWLLLDSRRPGAAMADARLRAATWFGLLLVFVQIGLGGLVSANFAATACSQFPACDASWLEAWSWASFNPWRELVLQSNDAIVIPLDAAAIHVTHRVTAVASGIYLLWLGLAAAGAGAGAAAAIARYGKALAGLTVLQALLGIAAIWFAHPLAVALAHNALAVAMLLALLGLVYRPHQHA